MSSAAPTLLGQTYGISMWPALRPGDLLFGHPLVEGERPPAGAVIVARREDGLIAHRLLRSSGKVFLLGGDLTGPDLPFDRAMVVGVATELIRGGRRRSIAGPMAVGPISRRVLQRLLAPLGRLSDRGPQNLRQLMLDEAAIRRLLEQ